MRHKLLVLASTLGVAGFGVGLTGAATLLPAPIFGSPIPIASAVEPVTIGDIDGDGVPDLAERISAFSAVGVSLGNGDGTFQTKRLYAAGSPGGAVAIGDLNGDAIIDLVVTNPFDDGVRVLPGPLPEPSPPDVPEDVSGATLYPTGDVPLALAVADLDQSGRLDLVVGNDVDETVSVLLADAGSGFQPKTDYPSGDVGADSTMTLADVNGDPALDIVVANYDSNTVSVLLGNPNGTFQARTSFGSEVLFLPRAVAVGDLDGDARADLAVGQQGHGIVVFLQQPDGTFTAQPPGLVVPDPVLLADVGSVEIADLNFDGNAEVVLGIWDTAGNPDPPRVIVLVGSGDGTFPELVEYPSESVPFVAIGDLNADGRLDLVASGGRWARLNESGPITPTGSTVVVAPIDATTGSVPVRITFTDVSRAGATTLRTTASGPPPPSDFTVGGAYYELATTAMFESAEVCFAIALLTAPTIAHWVGNPPVLELPTTYYRDAAGGIVPTHLGTFACAVVTAFSPFALLEPVPAEEDMEPPVVACGGPDGVWHAANVSIDCTADDGGSGLADPADAVFSLSTSVSDSLEDANAPTGSRYVCDLAGNCTTAGPIVGNKVDRKAPTLVLPANTTVDATSPAGATASYAASASDGADPSPGVSCSPASGSVFAIGTRSVACAATDHVGNATTGSFIVTVLGAKEQLAQLVQEVVAASVLPAAVRAQLLARIQPLLAAFDPSNPAQRRAVCTGLSAFTTLLRLLSGHGVPAAQASAWIADANRIRAVLAC